MYAAMRKPSLQSLEKEDKVEELMTGFDKRIQTLAEFAENKTAIIGMCTSGGFNILGNDGRCSLIGNEIGFENIGVDSNVDTSTHGNEASFEFVVERNPEYIFVMDRDAAINTEGAQLAQEIVENELVKERTHTKTDISCTWNTRQYGIRQRAELMHWISCCRIWKGTAVTIKIAFRKSLILGK